MKKRLNTIIQKAIEDHVFPGCVIGVVTRKGGKTVLPFGGFTYDTEAPEIAEDSIFDVASVTKSIPTSSLALKALEQGKIGLNDRLIEWVPEYNNSYRNDVCIKHLFTHTLDFDFRLSSCKAFPPEKILEAIFNAELRTPPGSQFFYFNATSILLGIVVERVFGKKLDKLAEDYFIRPLDMKCTAFFPEKRTIDSIVPTEIDNWRGRTVRGEIHDESAWVLSRIMTPGSSGLFSCAPDLLIFLEMILKDGVYKSHRYLEHDTIRLLSTNQIAYIGDCTGLGWELNQPQYMGEYCSQRTIGKTGFTGCVVMCDLEKGMGLVFLSNCTWPYKKEDKNQINMVRREVADVVFGRE